MLSISWQKANLFLVLTFLTSTIKLRPLWCAEEKVPFEFLLSILLHDLIPNLRQALAFDTLQLGHNLFLDHNPILSMITLLSSSIPALSWQLLPQSCSFPVPGYRKGEHNLTNLLLNSLLSSEHI